MSILKVLTDGTVEVHHFPKAGVSEELTVLQGHVGGYIETVPLHCFTDDMEDVPSFQKIVCLADEEGLIKKTPCEPTVPADRRQYRFCGYKGRQIRRVDRSSDRADPAGLSEESAWGISKGRSKRADMESAPTIRYI